MNAFWTFPYSKSLRLLIFVAAVGSFGSLATAQDLTAEQEAIRDASGRYRGGVSGSAVLGDTVSPISEGITVSTRMPRKKGRFTNRLMVEEFEGYEAELGNLLEINARVNKIKVRGKKVRYRGVLKIDNPLGLESAPVVGLLNAVAKKTRSGHKLTYPITLSRLLEADDFEFLDEDLQFAIFLNFLGTK